MPVPERLPPGEASLPGPEDVDSAELLRRVRNGDPEAKNALLALCYPRVLRLVQARLGPGLRQAYDPQDFVQDTMLVAFQSLEGAEIEELGQLISWLGTIAHHRITGAARRLYRLPPVLSELATPSAATSFAVRDRSSILSPGSQVARDDQLEQLLLQLDALPERDREVVYLRDIAGASWAFIAKELQMRGPSGACMLYTRTWAILRKRMTPPSHL